MKPEWLGLDVGQTHEMPFPLFLLPVVKDCNQPWLVVAVRHTCSAAEDALCIASNSDIGTH